MIRHLLAKIGPYAAEIVIALCITWCARCLALSPANMVGPFARYYDVMLAIDRHEWVWAALSEAAAIALWTGLACISWPGLNALSLAARILGLALAAFFLSVLGISWVIANTDSLASVPMLVLGLLGFLVLVRGPAIPVQRR